MAELMEGAMQQAPHPERHFIETLGCYENNSKHCMIDGW
jgi:hypothetical protein